ncbi:hypothetical protein CAPN004_09130 [Capnocytophaga cynodegmi]|uniref:restriction endonuclease subunit S n=1 Tax=Capnocytophaga cynodegmi TaxID=28189 RepID=UPI001AC28137|nr:restriction endonuclease subunit S [Capnocytophaga cynodegmi]GIM51883.1 hypothetical protein CAPN004_09130 [Capnocytophaga cynodegmi]
MKTLNVVSELSDCTEILTGRNIDKNKTNEQGNGTPYITGASDIVQGRIECKRYVLENEIKNPTVAKKGDIIISTVGTLGKIGIMTIERAVLSGHCAIIRPKKGVSMPYLVGIISRLVLDIPELDEFATGFSKKLDIEALKCISFTLPKLIVQEYILAQMASVTSLTMALETDKSDLEECEKLIDFLVKTHQETRKNYKNKIKTFEKLMIEFENIPRPDNELLTIIDTFKNINQRLKNL